MRRLWVLVAFLVFTAAGAVVIALPDSGSRLVLSSAHGPGVLDAAGIGLAVLGSGLVWWYVWRGRAYLDRVRPPVRSGRWFLAGAGLGLVLASVLIDFDAWWVIGAGLITLVQLTLFAAIAWPREIA